MSEFFENPLFREFVPRYSVSLGGGWDSPNSGSSGLARSTCTGGPNLGRAEQREMKGQLQFPFNHSSMFLSGRDLLTKAICVRAVVISSSPNVFAFSMIRLIARSLGSSSSRRAVLSSGMLCPLVIGRCRTSIHRNFRRTDTA